MNKPRMIRLLKYACVSIFLILSLTACEDNIYKATGEELSLIKTANLTTISEPGQVLTYTYDVKNNIKQNFTLSSMTIVVKDSPLDGPIVCSDSSLGYEESTTCTAKYTVTENDIANGSVTNNATVTGSFTSQDCIYPSKVAQSCNTVIANHTVTARASLTVYVDVSAPIPPTEPVVTPTQPSPILTGEVTYCNPATFMMNLRFVQSFIPGDFNHQVTINGDPMVCEVNKSNSSLLLCSYPYSAVFPANIKVLINNIAVNDFMYDGAACIITETPTNEPERAPTVCVPTPGGLPCP